MSLIIKIILWAIFVLMLGWEVVAYADGRITADQFFSFYTKVAIVTVIGFAISKVLKGAWRASRRAVSAESLGAVAGHASKYSDRFKQAMKTTRDA